MPNFLAVPMLLAGLAHELDRKAQRATAFPTESMQDFPRVDAAIEDWLKADRLKAALYRIDAAREADNA